MYLGIEIGGTKLQLGVGTGATADLVDFVRMDVDRAAGAAGVLDQIAEAGSRLVASHDIRKIGVGFGGPVDMTSGTVIKSHHVTGWDNFAICEWCARTLGVPAVVGNDCDVAALAEAKFGAGRDARVVLYVTVGTGIGGGLVIDNQLYAEHLPARTELGHLRPGLQCVGTDDIVEAQASGLGIAATFGRLVDTSDDASVAANLLERTGLTSPTEFTTKEIAALAEAGETHAVAAFGQATKALGWAIAQTVTLTATEVVVVGGGVSLAGEELFFEPIRRHAATFGYPPLADKYRIVPAALGEDVVVHGGLVLAA